MKRLVSILMVLTIAVMSLVVPVNAANVDLASDGWKVRFIDFDYTYYGFDNKYDTATKPNSFINMTIYTDPNVPKYRYYYRIVDCWGNDTDWVRVGEVKRNGRWAITVPVDISWRDINNISTRGFWSCNKVCTWETGSNVRIYLTARGLDNHNRFITDFHRYVYFEESTWSFCPATVTGWGGWNQGRAVSVHLPLYSFANCWTEGVRVYYWSKSSHTWERLHDFKRYKWGYYPDGGICCDEGYQVPWGIVDDMYVDGDGDIKLTARVIDREGDPISPYYNQYWNFRKFLYPWY